MTRHACEAKRQIDVAVDVLSGIDFQRTYEIQEVKVVFRQFLPFMPGEREIPESPLEPKPAWYYELFEIIGESSNSSQVVQILSVCVNAELSLSMSMLGIDGDMRLRMYDSAQFKHLIPTGEHLRVVDFKDADSFIEYLEHSKAFRNLLFEGIHRYAVDYMCTSIDETKLAVRVIDGKPWTVYVHDRRDWPVIDLERALKMPVEDLQYELFMFERNVLMNKKR